MCFIFPTESEAAFRGGDQHRALLLLGGDGGGGERGRQVGIWNSRGAPVGLLRPQQLGSGGQRKHPIASLQRAHEDLQAFVEPAQEGRAEELLRCPAREDRFLQRAGMLKVGSAEGCDFIPPLHIYLNQRK